MQQVSTAKDQGYQGSPKHSHLDHFYRLHGEYFRLLAAADKSPVDVEMATAALATMITDKEKRKQIWNDFAKNREDKKIGLSTASVNAVGDIMDFFVETMEIVETSTGGMG